MRTLPAVAGLRSAYAGAHLAWLVEEPASSALEGQPWIDEVLVFPRRKLLEALRRGRIGLFLEDLSRFVRMLRSRRFELVLDFHSLFRSSMLGLISGARRRVGYAPPTGREFSWLFAHDLVDIDAKGISRFERNAGMNQYLGIDDSVSRQAFVVDDEIRERMAKTLPEDRPTVVLHPGTSSSTLHKRWNVASYAKVAKELRDRDGVHCIVTCSSDLREASLARELVDASEGAANLAEPTRSLGELAALLASCQLLIASDTGPLHIASLAGTPVVQLLGPTHPVENAVYRGTPSRTVSARMECSPCRRGCADVTCMRLIEPSSVLVAARQLLDSNVVGVA
ncbi:glycosyltransferase family 9 protein [Myxococcota bacterium]|nr:glycosyltransferase family 9 protein [Myxococcota bacterium]